MINDYMKARNALTATPPDLIKAESLLRKVILANGVKKPSAVKDLMSLLCRDGINRHDEAIALAKSYRSDLTPEDQLKIDRLVLPYLIKAQRVDDAIELFGRIIAVSKPQAITPDYKSLIKLLELNQRLEDAAELIRRLRIRFPDEPSFTADLLRIEKTLFKEGADALSGYANYLVQNFSGRGLSEEIKSCGIYHQEDLQRIEVLFRREPESTPRSKGELLLTLAAMVLRAPLSSQGRNPIDLLMTALILLGRGWVEDRNLDVARNVLSEAFILGARQGTPGPALAELLRTYLPMDVHTEPTGTIEPDLYLKHVATVLADHVAARDRLHADISYFATLTPNAANSLRSVSRRIPELGQILPAEDLLIIGFQQESSRIGEERRALEDLDATPVVENTRVIVDTLRTVAAGTRFVCDAAEVRQLADAIEKLGVNLQSSSSPADHVEACRRALDQISALIGSIVRAPTRLLAEYIHPFLECITEELKERIKRDVARAKPLVRVRHLLENDHYYRGDDGSVRVALEVQSESGGLLVETVRVGILRSAQIQPRDAAVATGQLAGGKSCELSIPIIVEEPVGEELFEASARIFYDVPIEDGTLRRPEEQQMGIRFRVRSRDRFPDIPNPYIYYASGSPVENPDMFYGRGDILREMEQQLMGGPSGQCVMLYGEPRCGKSSVLLQLQRKLTTKPLVIRFGLLELGKSTFTARFVKRIIEELRDAAAKLDIDIGIDLPENTDGDPLDFLFDQLRIAQRELTRLGRSDFRLILLLDEFNIIHDWIAAGHIERSFMARWRGFLEANLFSAVVAGQDAMVEFRREFWNEFAHTSAYRLDYLSEPEAAQLAELPIPLDSHSRYRGGSLRRVFELTAGHPFYVQMVCDELVRTLAKRRSQYVTECLVNETVGTLTRGARRLTEEKFSFLLSCANDGKAPFPDHPAFRLTRAIANNGALPLGEELGLDSASTKDLVTILSDRGVIGRRRDGRHRLRVQLFSEWLRSAEQSWG